MTNENIFEIERTVRELFKRMTFEIKDLKVINKEDLYLVETDIDNPKTLIGERGQVLSDLQYIIRLVIRKKIGPDIFVELDINDYKKKKKEVLCEIAQDICNEVIFTKKEKALPPMNPYERRVIHLALKDREGIKTESVGEGSERQVVIKPAWL